MKKRSKLRLRRDLRSHTRRQRIKRRRSRSRCRGFGFGCRLLGGGLVAVEFGGGRLCLLGLWKQPRRWRRCRQGCSAGDLEGGS